MLARLRKLFGDPLFVRTQRGIVPTPRAEALAVPLKQWLAEAGDLVAGRRFDPATATFTARLAANDYIQSALLGHVAGAPGWTRQPQVLDGASDLFVRVLGARGQHTRAAFGAAELPLGACVESGRDRSRSSAR